MEIEIDVCSYCLIPFDLKDHRPYILSCGHTICKKYIDEAFSVINNTIKCPLDNGNLNY